jgi:hypothetical protein
MLYLYQIPQLNEQQPNGYELMCKEVIPATAWEPGIFYRAHLNKTKLNLPEFRIEKTGIYFKVYEEAIKYLKGIRAQNHAGRTYYLVKVTVETLEV